MRMINPAGIMRMGISAVKYSSAWLASGVVPEPERRTDHGTFKANAAGNRRKSVTPYGAVELRLVWRANSTPRSLFSRMVVARSIWSSGMEFLPP